MKQMKLFTVMLSAFVFISGALRAEEKTQLTEEQIAEMVNNPLSYLWMIAAQDDFITMDGDVSGADKIHANVLTVMPVMPIQFTKGYKLIVRPWFPVVSLDLPRNARKDLYWNEGELGGKVPTGIKDTSWNTGLGDIGLWAALAGNEAAKPPFVWALGLTTQFDTASSREFGAGKYSAGPMGLSFYIGEKWIVGGLFQHWWDYAGDDERAAVNKSNFQYVLQYRLTKKTNIGCSPNASYNWETDKYDLPVGLGMNTLIHIGKLPVKIGAEVYYHINNGPDALNNEWHARLLFVPIIPSPGWSRTPLINR